MDKQSVCKQSVSSKEKRWGKQACHQLEKPESVYSTPSFQNGEPAVTERNPQTGGFHDQVGFAGCIFLHSVSREFKKICEVLLGGRAISIPMSMFRTCYSPIRFHQITKSSNCLPSETCDINLNLSRRYALNWKDSRGSSGILRYNNPLVTRAGVCHKFKKISVDSVPGNGISGNGNQLERNDDFSSKRKIAENQIIMPGTLSELTSVNLTIDQGFGTSDVNYPGSPSSTTELSFPPASTNSSPKGREVLPSLYNSKLQLQTGAPMVDSEHGPFQWDFFSQTNISSSPSDRCISDRLGCSAPGKTHWGDLVIPGKEMAYKRIRTFSSEIGTSNISQMPKTYLHSHTNGQHSGFNLFEKDGGYQKSENDIPGERDLADINFRTDHNYSRVPAKFTEQNGGLRVTSQSRIIRMDSQPGSILETLPKIRDSNSGFVCIKGSPPSDKICCMETRPLQYSDRCNGHNMASGSLLCLSPVLSDTSCAKQNSTRSSSHSDTNNTLLANTTVVSASVEHVSKKTNFDPNFNHTIAIASRESTSVSTKQNSRTSGLAGYRKGLSLQGLSDKATQLITESRRPGTLGNYESAWKKWSSWCDSRKVDPFRCPLNCVLEYLSFLFYEEKFLYRTIGLHRSAISAYHVPIDDKPVGQHPLVCSLMSGIFNKRPPQPKYLFVWDVQVVLDFIKSKWGDTDTLAGKEVTLKLCMLMALITTSRALGLHHLDIRYMVHTENKATFHFHKLHKSWRRGNPPPSLDMYAYHADKELCVIHTLDRYLELTKERRKLSKATQLLLSYKKPYKEIGSKTISRWIKKVLRLANVDTNIFKGHSTRSASTSKVSLHGLALSDILQRGSWSAASTWQKFYNKHIISPEERFQNALLKNS